MRTPFLYLRDLQTNIANAKFFVSSHDILYGIICVVLHIYALILIDKTFYTPSSIDLYIYSIVTDKHVSLKASIIDKKKCR